MKKQKLSALERKKSLFLMLCIFIPIGSVGKAIEAAFPELFWLHQWILTAFVMVIATVNIGYIMNKTFDRLEERKAKEQALDEARKKEEEG
ncbi:MAG: hypothetical protein LBG30_04980 [Odoribacteraceae bacterium]|jgi:hypothetical protein|nr:hypothetical protein [Odoribacteraceae bacterium]